MHSSPTELSPRRRLLKCGLLKVNKAPLLRESFFEAFNLIPGKKGEKTYTNANVVLFALRDRYLRPSPATAASAHTCRLVNFRVKCISRIENSNEFAAECNDANCANWIQVVDCFFPCRAFERKNSANKNRARRQVIFAFNCWIIPLSHSGKLAMGVCRR